MTMNGWRRRLGGGWLLALLLLALPAAVYAQATPAAPPDGVVARLSFADQADLQWLSVRYDVWRVDHAAREVTVWLSAAELRQVQAQSRRVIVDQAATDDFYAAQSSRERRAERQRHPWLRLLSHRRGDPRQHGATRRRLPDAGARSHARA
jgi:hypothetical protein